MTTYEVVHETLYRYESVVSSSYGQVCLAPRDFDGQRCESSDLVIDPQPNDRRERIDYFGNRVSYFEVVRAHDELRITSHSRVVVDPIRGQARIQATQSLGQVRATLAALEGPKRIEAEHHLLDSARAPVDDRVRSYAAPSFADDARPLIDCLADLMGRIHRDFEFDAAATTVSSTLDDLFEHEAGVCQDFAHLAVACLRAGGLPARYVSGYLETVPPPGKDKLVGADVSHAWAAAMVPGAGWVDLDPTNDQFVDDRYITTGWGRDYADVPPLKGVIYSDSASTELEVSVDVRRLDT